MNPFYKGPQFQNFNRNNQPSWQGQGTPIMQTPSGFQNATNFLDRFNQFRQAFQGDPKAKVQELLNSGQMSQQQFQQLSQMANNFRGMFGR